jgi:hypothetical protein
VEQLKRFLTLNSEKGKQAMGGCFERKPVDWFKHFYGYFNNFFSIKFIKKLFQLKLNIISLILIEDTWNSQ